jgi:hypothetical protein
LRSSETNRCRIARNPGLDCSVLYNNVNSNKISVVSNFALFFFVEKLLPSAHIPFSTDRKGDFFRDSWGEEEK